MDESLALPCSIYRGGTSKGVFVRREALPGDIQTRDLVILALFGSPDLRQIDGLGGADPLTSKLGVVGPSRRSDADVDYVFGQVSITQPMVDYAGTCGNLLSAIGPFALDEGLVPPGEGVTSVRIHDVNTGGLVVAEVPTKDGRFDSEGTFRIDGVPGTGSRIVLDYKGAGGAKTGKLLPTGNPSDTMKTPSGTFTVSLVDAANPAVFVPASEVGLTGAELPDELLGNVRAMRVLEEIRSHACEWLGLVDDWRKATSQVPSLPKVAAVAAPMSYRTVTGSTVRADEIDVTARMMSMQKPHKAYAVSGAICTSVAAALNGTMVADVASTGGLPVVRIGHPSGSLECEVGVVREGDNYRLTRAATSRTARRIMVGTAFVSGAKLSQLRGISRDNRASMG